MACRPCGFLIGLPFMLLAFFLTLLGIVIWVVGSVFSCICPCCACIPWILELAISLIKMPFKVIVWFTSKFPC